MTRQIRKGDRVRYRDFRDQWHDGEAVSDVEGLYETDPKTRQRRKIHDFPVIWVRGRSQTPIPWPVEDVELLDSERTDDA